MPDLIAQGLNPPQRWRHPLPEGQAVVLGRAPDTWVVTWDPLISRRHAEVCWRNGKLHVQRLPEARNPLFVRGQPHDTFTLLPGESFTSGDTTFTLSDAPPRVRADLPLPLTEQVFHSEDLQEVRFRDADRRLDILSRLPEVISGATSDGELFIRLGNMFLAGIPHADAVAVVAVTPGATDASGIEVLHQERRRDVGGTFEPSQRLILRAIGSQESVAHVWGENDKTSDMTVKDNFDWAYCTPVPGESCAGWGLYVTGQSPQGAGALPMDLRTDLKFTELVAAILSSLRQVRLLERRHAMLSQFFSPSVLKALGTADADRRLAPRETEVSVLFCDLRGFSREADRSATDLLGLLKRVSKALGVMTRHILDQGGVIADFQGDAALGFWGWPLAEPDSVARACQAALGIRTQFGADARRAGHTLAGFQMGIGIATGRAVAGQIGPADQAKVGVFGPVVNLGSRLEGMTKFLHAPILLDEATAKLAREQVAPRVGRFRRVARVRPYGIDTPLTVTELLPPAEEYPELSDEHLAYYDEALNALEAGRWPEAYDLLHKIPPGDRVKDFLTMHIVEHNRMAPSHWDGVIALPRKS